MDSLDKLANFADNISNIALILIFLYGTFENFLNKLSYMELLKLSFVLIVILLVELSFYSHLKSEYNYYDRVIIKLLFVKSLKVFFAYIPISIFFWGVLFQKKYLYSCVALFLFPFAFLTQLYLIPSILTELRNLDILF